MHLAHFKIACKLQRMFIVLSFNVKITVFIAEFASSSTADAFFHSSSPTPIIHSFLRPQISIINYSLPNMSIAILLIFLSILLFWVVRIFLRFNKELRRRNELGAKIFGPPANSLFGNLAMFPKCKYEWTAFLIDQSNKALEKGESMIRWWTGPTKLAIWTLDSDTSRMLLENTRELKKGRDYAFYEQWLGRGLLLSDGEIWREHRKALTPTFHFSMLDQYCAVFNRQAKILIQRLEMVEGKGQLDISPLLTRCSLDIIGEAAMGIRLNSQQNGSPDYVEAVHQFNFFAHVFNTNLLYWFPPFWKISGWKKKTEECVNVLKKFSKKVIEERINANGNIEENGKREGRGKAFLDLLLELEAEGRLNRKQVQEQMDTFLFAGHDTTASALGWTLWCLAAHPECQKLARNEILEAVGGEGNAQIDANGANELRYLDRCLRESLRIFPPVPVVERDLEEDLWIGDKLVPKGTMVVVSPVILHHREKIYPRHWEFDPDNFLPERHSSRNSFDFVPFSAGPRNCIGQRFAFLELKILLVQILRRFSLSTDIPFLANRPGLEAILRPELGISVKIDAIEEC